MPPAALSPPCMPCSLAVCTLQTAACCWAGDGNWWLQMKRTDGRSSGFSGCSRVAAAQPEGWCILWVWHGEGMRPGRSRVGEEGRKPWKTCWAWLDRGLERGDKGRRKGFGCCLLNGRRENVFGGVGLSARCGHSGGRRAAAVASVLAGSAGLLGVSQGKIWERDRMRRAKKAPEKGGGRCGCDCLRRGSANEQLPSTRVGVSMCVMQLLGWRRCPDLLHCLGRWASTQRRLLPPELLPAHAEPQSSCALGCRSPGCRCRYGCHRRL